MLKRGNASMMVGASSWKDQFVDAFTVQAGKFFCYFFFILGFLDFCCHHQQRSSYFYKQSLLNTEKVEICFIFNFCPNFSGDDDEEEEEGGDEGEEGEEKMPTCGDYIMHFLTLFWKVIFAVIPPAGKQ